MPFAREKLAVSPYINRFLSADTVVANPSDPQAFNRYTYAYNNPLRYVDPSGHASVCGFSYSDPECPTKLPAPVKQPPTYTPPTNKPGGGPLITVVPPGPSSGGPVVSVVPPGSASGDPVDSIVPSGSTSLDPLLTLPTTTPPSFVESYCGDISPLACAAMLTQDVATVTDFVGVGLIETPAVAVGCFEGGPLGCAIAEVGVIATWNVTLNNVETAASSLSLVLTVTDDIVNNGGWGENSSTALATWATGLLPLTPSWDLAIDTYSSGYNRGVFNGISTIWTDGLIK